MKRILYIKNISGKGRGVCCTTLIKKDEVIEVCPVLVTHAPDQEALKTSRLVDYFFNFNKEEGTLALALGFGSLYNHAVFSNAAYSLDQEQQTMTYYALEDIPAGKEICINYGGEYGKEYQEWFESRNIELKK
ncbi:MAG: SET domain-containing protein-lysine N-methyltransferase [Bacteroidetes bacterium]|nr:SET domain-containing protein-lysine N-methyltransferase [Bacteroidota bacterium]